MKGYIILGNELDRMWKEGSAAFLEILSGTYLELLWKMTKKHSEIRCPVKRFKPSTSRKRNHKL
jgi:hypothetical protein